MPYNEQKKKLGHHPIYLVKLEIGSQVYGFSSLRMNNFEFGAPPAFPTLLSVSTSPTVLTPAKGFGVRSSCSVTIQDCPWTDVGILSASELAATTQDPDETGTLWGKFFARHPFYENSKMTVKTGYLADNGDMLSSNFIERVYFIDKIEGPDKGGKVTITGKDILRFADNSKAQIPTQSQATLDNNITSDGNFDITDPNDDIINNYNAGQTYIRINDEVMEITAAPTGSNPNYNIHVDRASVPTPRYSSSAMAVQNHSSGSTVQHCHNFVNIRPDDLLEYLLETVAGISSIYLDKSGWQSVINFGLSSYLFNALLTEPEGVKDLIEEITQHSIFLWWDERAQKVKMKSMLSLDVDHGPFTDEEHIAADSVSVSRDSKNRASQVWLMYGHRNPVQDLDKFNYFDSIEVNADLATEGASQYGTKKVNKIWSRWLARSQKTIAAEITQRLVAEYKDTKTHIAMTMTPKDDDVWTGDLVSVKTFNVQNSDGTNPTKNYRVLEARENLSAGKVSYGYKIASIGTGTAISGRTGVIGPNNTLNDYANESESNKSTYAFIAYNDRGDGVAGFPPTDEPYHIV